MKKLILIEYNGKTQCLKKWCEELNVNYPLVCNRMYRGWGFLRAISTPKIEAIREKNTKEEYRHEICNNCTSPFKYRAKDYYRRIYPFTCNDCVTRYLNRPNPFGKHHCTRHGEFTGRKKTKIYRLWASIRERCNNPKNRSYKFYGAKGIKVCERWDDFATFKRDVVVLGYREGYSIIRIDKTKDYELSNIVVNFGKGTAKYFEYRGMKLKLEHLFKHATNGTTRRNLQKRLLTRSIEEALHGPLAPRKKKPMVYKSAG